MTANVTDAELARVVELDEKATKGIEVNPTGDVGPWIVGTSTFFVADFSCDYISTTREEMVANAECFAAFRDLCPKLARELIATREKLRVAREAINFVLEECDWDRGDSDQPFGGGDERIGPSLTEALTQLDA